LHATDLVGASGCGDDFIRRENIVRDSECIVNLLCKPVNVHVGGLELIAVNLPDEVGIRLGRIGTKLETTNDHELDLHLGDGVPKFIQTAGFVSDFAKKDKRELFGLVRQSKEIAYLLNEHAAVGRPFQQSIVELATIVFSDRRTMGDGMARLVLGVGKRHQETVAKGRFKSNHARIVVAASQKGPLEQSLVVNLPLELGHLGFNRKGPGTHVRSCFLCWNWWKFRDLGKLQAIVDRRIRFAIRCIAWTRGWNNWVESIHQLDGLVDISIKNANAVRESVIASH
jgi:hypothetical protein